MALMLLWWVAVWIKAWFGRGFRRKHGSRVQGLRLATRAQPKPAWVRREVIRLKALMPDAGCRTVAHVFNRRYAAGRKTTVLSGVMLGRAVCRWQKTLRGDGWVMKMRVGKADSMKGR
jgi:hypothetical protein